MMPKMILLDRPYDTLSSRLLLLVLITSCIMTAAHARSRSVSLSPTCTLPSTDPDEPDSVTLGNVSETNGVGPWTDNKTLVLRWSPSYIRTRDAVYCDRSPINMVNPLNLATRTMEIPLTCNYTNITHNSSALVFYNLTVAARFLTSSSVPATWRVTTIIHGHNGDKHMIALNATNQGPFNVSRPYFLSLPNLRVNPNTSTNATLRISIVPGSTGTYTYPSGYEFNVTAFFLCEVYIVYNVLVVGSGSSGSVTLFAFLIPLAIFALLATIAFVRYKFPQLFARNDPNKNNQHMSQRAVSEKPLLINDKRGMVTWMDQAEDVVADLNRTQLYLAEAQPDKPSDNMELQTLVADGGAGAASGNTLDAHSAGFIGGRRVFAAGAATVQLKDHKVTMGVRNTKPNNDDDDDYL